MKIESNCKTREEAEIVVYVAKKVVTMDESLPEAKAVAVDTKKGIIISVGELEEMYPWTKGKKVFIDKTFEKQVMYPGFIDNHLHTSMAVVLMPSEFLAPDDWALPKGFYPGVLGEENYDKKLKEYIDNYDNKYPAFMSWGFLKTVHGEMTAQRLDKICADIPIIIWERSYHEVYLNTKALEHFGIDKKVVEEHGANYEKGQFIEGALFGVIPYLNKFLLSDDWLIEGLKQLALLLNQVGITTNVELAFGTLNCNLELESLRKLKEFKELQFFRSYNVPMMSSFAMAGSGGKEPFNVKIANETYDKFVEDFKKNPVKDVYMLDSFKLMFDGAIVSGNMVIGEPGYIDGHDGVWISAPELMEKILVDVWNTGKQVHVHCTGDKAHEKLVDIVEKAYNQKPLADHRMVFHHYGFTTNEVARKIAKVGCVVSANPYYNFLVADVYATDLMGFDRAKGLSKLKSVIRNGVSLSLHSDMAVAPANPLLLAWCAVNKVSSTGMKLYEEERLTVYEAMRAVTLEAAYAMKLEREIGSIIAGKKADFTILDSDPQDGDPMKLKDVKIWGTVFEGKPFKALAMTENKSMLRKTLDMFKPFNKEEFIKNKLHIVEGQKPCGCASESGYDRDVCLFALRFGNAVQK